MLRRWLACCLGLAVACGLPAPAAAHTLSESHSNWQVSGRAVRVDFTLPDLEVRRLSGPDHAPPSSEALGAYLAQRLGAASAAGPCPLVGRPLPEPATGGVRRFSLTFDCPSADKIVLSSTVLLDRAPGHTDFAQVQTADGRYVEQLLTRDHTALELSGGDAGAELKSAGFLRYVALGVMHIFTGVDHQTFLLGLILLSRRLKDVLFVVTGFTLGHSATLALAATGILRPHPEYIDALIGLTIALLGAEGVAAATGKPLPVAAAVIGLTLVMAALGWAGLGGLPTLLLVGGGLFGANYLVVAGHVRDAARLRLVVTMVFGLIHGFGFAAGLLEMKLPRERLFELLLGFNLGVELGQMTLVLAVLGLAALLVRWRIAPPRRLVSELGSALLVAVGLYWFVGRSFGLPA